MDSVANFAVGTVATAPSPATSGTSIVLTSGQGARFPAAPFNVTLVPSGTSPDSYYTTAEIARVTAISTDTLTITRAQEGSTARSVATGWLVMLAPTAKSMTDRFGWGLDVTEDMSSLTNWTGVTGSWSISSSITQQTSTSASQMRLKYNNVVCRPMTVAEVECRYDSGSGSIRRMGLGLHWNGTSGSAAVAFLETANGTSFTVSTERDAITGYTSGDSVSYGGSGYTKLRIAMVGEIMSVFLDGTFVVNVGDSPAGNARAAYPYLYTYGQAASFRNFKLWTGGFPS